MPPDVEWTTPRGGFFSWLTLPGRDATEVARRAAEAGVAVVPGALFHPDGRGAENLRLSFSMVDEARIAGGIETLASLL
jgi:DNA-binding transcriptional MocR family regulator